MKELAAPHNDWWTKKRPLPFAPNHLSKEVEEIKQTVIDAGEFAQGIRAGILKLEKSAKYQQIREALSLPEQLRPIFCETEINLESDLTPQEDKAAEVRIPSAFVLGAGWGNFPFLLDQAEYQGLLSQFQMGFSTTKMPPEDADHAWLTPVKGFSDRQAILSLQDRGLVEEDWVAKVESIDKATPAFSAARCGLLREVPLHPTKEWKTLFEEALKANGSVAALELRALLQDAKKKRAVLQSEAAEFAKDQAKELKTEAGRLAAFKRLLAVRQAVFHSEISKNPRGQILEPGFRVIFPAPLMKAP
jgi:hypothetical protein